jgi:hypothetical protein
MVMRTSQLRFIRQQGFTSEDSDEYLYAALMVQPKLVGAIVLMGALFQNGWVFLALSASLWWSALQPTRNVFDAIYNLAVAKPRGLPQPAVAPAPRRFAMGMAGTLALIIGFAILLDAYRTAWTCEALFLAAVGAVIFGRFCLGAYLFHAVLQARASSVSRLRSRPCRV